MKTKYEIIPRLPSVKLYPDDEYMGNRKDYDGSTPARWVKWGETCYKTDEFVTFKYRRPIKTARKQPTTRALLNAGGVKKSRPALRKARDVGGN